MKVPVVLPVVHINVATHGRLTIDIDGDPYQPDSVFTRRHLRDVLDEITTTLDSPVRVEVNETDGTTYADIATPPASPALPVDEGRPQSGEPAGDDRAGFQPGEEVALAYVLTRQRADADGVAPLRLPPALLASRREGLVMVGLTSHVIATVQ
jgi:hypothetical protein